MARARLIAITGAGGFVGGWLRRALAGDVEAGTVRVLPTSAGGADGMDALDITDRRAVAAFIADRRPDVVVHLAAMAAPADARRDPARAWRVNVDGTLNLARAILDASPATRLVFAGSSEAYGASFNAHGGRLDETAALEPMTPYAAGKAAADLALGQMARDGLDCVRFRPFNHTGPGQPPTYVVPAFASQVAAIMRGKGPPTVRTGNLEAVRDFLDVRDVVRAYRMAALCRTPFADGPAINLATGTGRRIADILDMLIGRADRPVTVETDPDRLRPSEVPTAIGEPGRAAAVFGWHPQIAFEQTVDDVLSDCLHAAGH